MARVLFGTEFGAGNGHILPMKAIAAAMSLRRPEADFQFFVPFSSGPAEKYLPAHQICSPDFLRGGLGSAPVKRGATHGEMLATLLLGNETSFVARLRGWRDAIGEFRPDVVIADYAPCLCMAASGRSPVLSVANGYTLPPPEADHFTPVWPAPDFDPRSEESLVAGFNRALMQADLKTLSRLPQMNRADAYALMTVPIFDPYWQTRTQQYLGIFHPEGSPAPAPPKGRGIAYFSGSTDPSVHDKIASGLHESGTPILAHVLRKSASKLNVNADTKVDFRRDLHNLKTDLPGSSVAIHASSLGMAGAALFAGVPQVMICAHDENSANAQGAMLAQIGKGVEGRHATTSSIASLIRDVAGDEKVRGYAVALAERYAPFRNADPAARAAADSGHVQRGPYC